MNKAQQVLELFYGSSYIDSKNEVFEPSDYDRDSKRSSNFDKSRKAKLGWKKYRSHYNIANHRHNRLSQLFSGRKSLLIAVKSRIKKVRRSIERQKNRKIKNQLQLDKKKLNLIDSNN